MLRPWKITLGRIDPARSTPLYLQIAHAIVHEIERGRLAAETFLPSSRQLADILGVNRKTVVLAYEDLIAQGWLESRGTRGTVVAREMAGLRRPEQPPVPQAGPVRPDYFVHQPPARPLAMPSGGGIKINEGSPDGRLFSTDVLARALRSAVLRGTRDNGLLYRDPRGSPRLREEIATMLRGERGLNVEAENICITRGSQNAIFLAAQALLSPGDTVIVEELTYEPAVAAFTALGARVVGVPLTEHGIDTRAVEAACRAHRVRAIFLTPHHQFPTTIALRPEGRLRLLELARQFRFAVIEDDYDHEFHFETQPLLPMASYALDRVIYVGSLSKLLLPALRVGYVAAPASVIDAIAHGVSLTDGMGNSLIEEAVVELISDGELRRHARRATQIYAERRLAFADLLRSELGGHVDFRVPDGGLAFWLRFPDGHLLDRIEANAAMHKLTLAPSASFIARPGAERGLRIGFGSFTPPEAQAAVEALARAGGLGR